MEEGATERESFLSLRVTLQPIDPKTGINTQAEPMVLSEKSKFTRTTKGGHALRKR